MGYGKLILWIIITYLLIGLIGFILDGANDPINIIMWPAEFIRGLIS